jgi:hypothetical protein
MVHRHVYKTVTGHFTELTESLLQLNRFSFCLQILYMFSSLDYFLCYFALLVAFIFIYLCYESQRYNKHFFLLKFFKCVPCITWWLWELACRNHKWRQCSSLPSISRALFTLNSFHKAKQSAKLIMWKYWRGYVKLCIEKSWNLVQLLESPPWHYSSSQGAHCQAVSGLKIDYYNGTPTLFPLFFSEWLLAVFKNKFCLKGTKISGYWKHKTKSDDGTESYSRTGIPKMFRTVAGSIVGLYA